MVWPAEFVVVVVVVVECGRSSFVRFVRCFVLLVWCCVDG